jgi:hypothetical protein
MTSREAVVGAVLAGVIVGGGVGASEGDVWVGIAVAVLMTVAVGILNARAARASRSRRARQP